MTTDASNPETEDQEEGQEPSFEDQLAAQFEAPSDEPADQDDSQEPAGEEPADEAPAEASADDVGAGEEESQTPEPPAATDDLIEVGGVKYQREEVEGVLQWISNLTPEQAVAIQKALSDGDDAPEAPADQGPTLDPDEVLDPKLAEYVEERMAALQAELDAQRELVARQQQVEGQRTQQQLEAALDEARRGTQEKFGLSAEELQALQVATEESGITAFLAQKHGLANPKAVFEQAMEQTYWATPQFRDRAIQQATESTAEEVLALANKKAKAGSLTAKGATAPRTETTPANLTEEERFQEMVKALRADMEQSV